MSARRHAEVAGAGLGGLAVASALAQRGWSVRVHERSAELKELGVGIGLWGNGQRAARVLGVLENLLPGGSILERWRMFDENVQLIANSEQPTRGMGHAQGLLSTFRTDLYRELIDAAQRFGVEVRTNSPVRSAEPDGVLVLADGTRCAADLVVGADGYASTIRDSLGLAKSVGYVSDGYLGRILVDRRPDETREQGEEHWSGPRRVGIISAGPRFIYIYLSGPENLDEVQRNRWDKPLWVRHYPHLRDLFDRIPEDYEVLWTRYPRVVCHAWSSGRAVLIGDAAHAVPPTVAQGAGFALTDAVSLAAALDRTPSVTDALQKWEARERPVIDATQRLGVLMVLWNKLWPPDLLDARSDIVRGVLASQEFSEQFMAAAKHQLLLDDPPPMAAAGA